MSAPVVLVTSRSFSTGTVDAAAQLAASGLEVRPGAPSHDLAELASQLPDAVAWIAGAGPVTGRHLEHAPRLKIVARYGVGVDAVDLRAAAARGILVTNTPGANSDSVADFAVALMLVSLRSIVPAASRDRAGRWDGRVGAQLGDARVGLVGFGRVGQAVARRLAGFGCRVAVHDPYVPARVVSGYRAHPAGLAGLAQICDIVSLHAPGGEQIIGEQWLSEVRRPGLVLVNTARADLIDETAVAASLRDGRLAAFAADTIGAGLTSPLLDAGLADRVVVTPHIAAHTRQAIDAMSTMTTADVLAALAGRPPRHLVPMPGGQ